MANDKSTRAELIAALVTDKHSGFKDGDEAILEAASDVRLEEFRTATEAHRAATGAVGKLETENRNVSARLKVAEDRIKASEQTLTEEEFIARAPASIKTLLDAHKAQEDATRASIVSQLKDLGAHTEDELKKKSIEELKTLAQYARVSVPDFSGRGLPQERHASSRRENYAPPNPYPDLEPKAKSKSKTVN